MQNADLSTLCNALIISVVQVKSAGCRQNQQNQLLGVRAPQKRCQETQALMGATRLASGKRCNFILVEVVLSPFITPTRDASPPLVVAFSGSV